MARQVMIKGDRRGRGIVLSQRAITFVRFLQRSMAFASYPIESLRRRVELCGTLEKVQ